MSNNINVITQKEELYDKCENMEELYDKFYYPLLVEYKELKKQLEDYKKLGFKYLQDKNNNLETQLEEYKKDIKDLDNQNKRAFENMQLNQLKVCNMVKQQKEFIKWLESIKFIRIIPIEMVCDKYKETIGGSDENKTTI